MKVDEIGPERECDSAKVAYQEGLEEGSINKNGPHGQALWRRQNCGHFVTFLLPPGPTETILRPGISANLHNEPWTPLLWWILP